jgi:hypothetical protein
MSLKNISRLYSLTYGYLGYKKISRNEEIDKLIESSIDEVIKLSQFSYIYQEFDYKLDFLLNNKAYIKLLDGCNCYYLVLTTLGKKIDDRCRYYSKADLTKMVVFDAVSSAYLEYMADEYEKTNFPLDRTYRFGCGYQGTSVSDINIIFKYLDHNKLGVSINEANLMTPLKTMCGIIGIGKAKKSECGNCNIKEKCELKKEGKTCY